jgi:hypothetical protein
VEIRVSAPDEQERDHVGVQRVACGGKAGGFGVDRAAEEGPSVAAVIFDVVSGVEQVAQAGQVVFCDCLVSRGERLLLHYCAAASDVGAHHLVGDSFCLMPCDELAVDFLGGLALRRVCLKFSLEQVIDGGGERVET